MAETHGAPSIAFLGLGAMGSPMALRLMRAGYRLRVWNRTRAKATALEPEGALVAADPVGAVSDADIVIVMLESAAAVDQVMFSPGMVRAYRRGATVIDMSSIPPSVSMEHARQLHELGVDYLDAPVSGGTQGASDGSLTILVGGQQAALERCRPILEVLGTPSRIGPVGAGQVAKLVNQVIVAGTIGAVSEGLALADALGIDGRVLLVSLRGGFADSRILREHGERMVGSSFEPGAKISLHVKDLETALAAREHATKWVELPIAALVLDAYRELAVLGYDNLDHSALRLWFESV